MLDLLAQLPQAPFDRPPIDWHALAPELILLGFGALITVLDVWLLERARAITSALAGIALLVTMIPIITLALDDGGDRVLFGGAYVVDDFSLIMKAVFLGAGYLVILLSTNYIAEGDYWESEYYGLMLSSILGMVVMASSRDLISVFVALELLSIPAYLLAAWRKRDPRSNEAGLKYYLMGVFASAVLLYGMSLLYGVTGTTILADIGTQIGDNPGNPAIITLAIVFIVAGFAFKISAVPFHNWAPDTYEGAPTPVTAFLAVGSKAAGFVGLLILLYQAFPGASDVYHWLFFILATASMTIGNFIALRQTNIIRLMAYSGVAQTGFMLAPLAVAGIAGVEDTALRAVVQYLVIYAVMNLGAFGVVIALARKTRSADIDSFAGAFQYAPALTVSMTIFFMSLVGFPPFGGWFAKFNVFRALADANTTMAWVLAVIVAVNSVIAAYYYLAVLRRMWADEAPDGDLSPIRVPPSLVAAIGIAVVVTMAFGVLPGLVTDLTEVTLLTAP